MSVTAIVQARLTSSRLPLKVLADICGMPMIHRVIRRLKASDVDEVVVAAPYESHTIADACEAAGVQCIFGPEDDVLKRFMLCAEALGLQHDDLILRVTGDCPLIEPMVINGLIHNMKPHLDYVSNVHPKRTYPRGLDAELFWVDTLCRLDRMTTAMSQREHVTPLIHKIPELWVVSGGQDIENNSDLRWCVDEEADLKVIRRLYETGITDYRSLVAHARSHPECTANSRVEQKTV